ncbi:MAG: hypothetical protein QF432_06620 [Dehalococcoidales bacterium]|jgi:hypothetical protein|nr:hypothetical protein [Dehalococcoidales bacterium]
MGTPKKLVCDRCGNEVSNKYAIELLLEGAEAWQLSVIERDSMPRGLFPCENYRLCGGEMNPPKSKSLFSRGGDDE